MTMSSFYKFKKSSSKFEEVYYFTFEYASDGVNKSAPRFCNLFETN
jgi:hypothetical protein